MARIAVAAAGSSGVASRPQNEAEPHVSETLKSLGKQLGYGRGRHLRPRRSQLATIVGVVVAAWIVLAFGRTLTTLNAATERQSQMAAEAAALVRRLDAGNREFALVQSDGFQRFQARAFGMGAPGEQVFSLDPDIAPPPIVPLGGPTTETLAQAPLDAWLTLLFGE